MKSLLFFFIPLVLSHGLLFGQEGTITGTVTSAEDGLTILGATVVIKGNPVGHMLSIDADVAIERVTISDITGAVVRDEWMNNETFRMEVSDLQRGIHVVTLQSGSLNRVLKKVKE